MRMARLMLTGLLVVPALVGCAYIGSRPSPEPATPLVTPSVSAARDGGRPTSSASPEGFVSPDEAEALIRECGIGGRVAAYFRIPDGNDYRDHFPNMGRAPEIEGASGLFVVVYEGPVSGPFLGAPGASREPPSDALCVITPAGEPLIYGDVSRDGMVLPAGAFVAPTQQSPEPTQAATVESSINEVEAVELARAHLADPQSAVVWGWEHGPFEYVYREFENSPGRPEQPLPDVAPPDKWVWAVLFYVWVEICPPDGGECQTRRGLASIFLAGDTGDFLMSSTVAPNSPSELPTPMYGSGPIVEPLQLSISNATTLAITLMVNGKTVLVAEPGTRLGPIEDQQLPGAPWHVEALTPSGRVLLSMDVAPGDVWQTEEGPNGGTAHRGAGARADLSCGRLDVWSGPPMSGPAPPSSFPPGDCDP